MFDANFLIDELKITDHLPTKIVNILKENHFKNEAEFYRFYEKLLIKYTNSYLIKGQFIEFYPIIQERIARSDFSCYLSGTKINCGNTYIAYHPFVEDLDNRRVYVIKKEIKALPDFLDVLPKNMVTYEDWHSRLKNCYQNEIINGGGVDFYNLSVECGENCLDLYPLKLSRKKSLPQKKEL